MSREKTSQSPKNINSLRSPVYNAASDIYNYECDLSKYSTLLNQAVASFLSYRLQVYDFVFEVYINFQGAPS